MSRKSRIDKTLVLLYYITSLLNFQAIHKNIIWSWVSLGFGHQLMPMSNVLMHAMSWQCMFALCV